jgi:hypothetical protein
MLGFFDREQLAEFTDTTPRTIARWDAKRIGPPRVKIGRKWYYPIPEANNWLKAQIEFQRNAPDAGQAA